MTLVTYIAFMEKINSNRTAAQGAAVPTPPDAQTVREWAKKDIGLAIGVLNAIYSDPDLLNSVADWIHGRIMNDHNKKVNRKEG